MPEGVSRRGESWRAWYRNPETGRQHERSFPKQAEAVRWRRQQLDAFDRGRWVDPEAGKVSFVRYFEAWERNQVWTDGTRRAMLLAARSTSFADVDLRRVRPSHVEAWVKSMTVATPDRPRALAPGTIKTRFVNVRSVFRGSRTRRDDRGRPHGPGPNSPLAQARGSDDDPRAGGGPADPRRLRLTFRTSR